LLAQPPTSSQADTLARRARSAARRLLAGAGTASVVAFRREGRPSAESVHHAWLQDALLVGLPADAVADWSDDGQAVDVRLDIESSAPTYEWRVTAQSLHALGTLHGLSGPGRGAIRWATLQIDQAFLHDPFGVHAVADACAADRDPAFPGPADALAVQETLAGHGPEFLAELFERAPIRCRTRRACADLGVCGRTLLMDADACGLTLGAFDEDHVVSALIPFDRPLTSADALEHALEAVLAQA